MSDLGWVKYITSIETSHELTCLHHSKKYGIDGLNTETDCNNLPCLVNCPLRKEGGDGENMPF